MEERAHATQTAIARPLPVLAPLIQRDLKQGREAAARASLPYYRAAGEKLLEAKEQLPHGEFMPWVKRNFSLSIETAKHYMRLAAHPATGETGGALPFSSISDFIRQTSNPHYNRPSPWQEPLKEIASRIDTETLNRKREEIKRADEREIQRALGLQLISIGYKVLAAKLHPDKGGSRDAMVRLNAVRERLKLCV